MLDTWVEPEELHTLSINRQINVIENHFVGLGIIKEFSFQMTSCRLTMDVKLKNQNQYKRR